MEQPQLNFDIKATTSVEGPKGERIFQQGFILRKISKFLVGADEDSFVPIPIFYEPVSGKMIIDSLPPELRDEYRDIAL
jgi:hypothetical protein